MKYDQFEFNTAIKELESRNGFYMVLKSYINGVDLSGKYEIRDDNFVHSLETTKLANTGEYCIVACSCGNPECVGIYSGS